MRPKFHRPAAFWADMPLRRKALTIVALPMIPVLVGLGFIKTEAAADARIDHQIAQLRQAKTDLDHVLEGLVDAETGVRGFLLTREKGYLQPYERAHEELSMSTAPLADIGQGVVGGSVEEADSLVREQLATLERLRFLGAGSHREKQELLDQGKALMDRLRDQIGAIVAGADDQIRAAEVKREAFRARAETTFWVVGLLGLAGALVGTWLLISDIVRRVKLAADNAALLRERQPLLPTTGGSDEIGTLASALERTADILQAQEALRDEAEVALRHAKEAADLANRSKSEFLSRMSHELRTPLNGILGFAQLLEIEDGLEPDQVESVNQITRAGGHLLDLINEVLDLSRIESGQLSVSLEPVSLDDIVRECAALIQPLAAQRGLTLRVDEPKDRNIHALADRQRLKQLLLNLLSNATKYNRRDGQILVTYDRSPDGTVELAVADTGLGIPSHKLERLFTPFDRLDVPDEQEEGTGLGLALSKRLAEVMNGSLSVVSEPGSGSRFSIHLPVTDPPLDSTSAVPVRDHASVSQSRSGSTVLYVEDNAANLKLVERIFKRRPMITLQSVMQGQLGIDLARDLAPDLILLDMNLPDMNGDEVLLRLRQDPLTNSIPVVMLSADATERQISRMLAAGAAAYVTKPLDVLEFLRTVDEILTKGSEYAAIK